MVCFFFKQKTAYEMRISDWSSDVCSSDLKLLILLERRELAFAFRCALERLRDHRREVGRQGEVGLRGRAAARQDRGGLVQFQLAVGRDLLVRELGRASWRERVGPYV